MKQEMQQMYRFLDLWFDTGDVKYRDEIILIFLNNGADTHTLEYLNIMLENKNHNDMIKFFYKIKED